LWSKNLMERGYLEDYKTRKNNKMEGMTRFHVVQGIDTWFCVMSILSHKTQPVSGLGEELLATQVRWTQETHKWLHNRPILLNKTTITWPDTTRHSFIMTVTIFKHNMHRFFKENVMCL
jgi:hypothetical protein